MQKNKPKKIEEVPEESDDIETRSDIINIETQPDIEDDLVSVAGSVTTEEDF